MKYILFAAGVILLVFIVALMQIPIGIEPLSELYFEEHTELPKHIFLDKIYNFSFTVNNLEYQSMQYNYTISAEYDDQSFLLDRNTMHLPDNRSRTVYHEFKIDEHFERARVVVRLEKLSENPHARDPNYPKQIEIHFWVEEIVGPTIIITDD